MEESLDNSMCNNDLLVIYGLVDPITKEVRYIGKSNNPFSRYLSHLGDINKKTHKSYWIKKLKESDLVPKFITIEFVEEDKWIDREKYWIKFFPNLTNIQDGGQGASVGHVFSEETKAKISKTLTGHRDSEETIKKRFENRSKPNWTDEAKEYLRIRFSGEKSNNAKLTNSQVISIKEMLNDNIHPEKISKSFRISRQAIDDIKHGRTWKNVI